MLVRVFGVHTGVRGLLKLLNPKPQAVSDRRDNLVAEARRMALPEGKVRFKPGQELGLILTTISKDINDSTDNSSSNNKRDLMGSADIVLTIVVLIILRIVVFRL